MIKILNLLIINLWIIVHPIWALEITEQKENHEGLINVRNNANFEESDIIIRLTEISHVSNCNNPNGKASVAVEGDLRNYTFTWYDSEGNNLHIVGKQISNLNIGTYYVQATHSETGKVSAQLMFQIELLLPNVTFASQNNTSCDPSIPNGELHAIIDNQTNSNFAYYWYSGLITTSENLIAASTVVPNVPAGTYTLVVANLSPGNCTSDPFHIEVWDQRNLPVIDLSIIHNSGCTPNGEISIVKVTESSIIKDPEDYKFTLYSNSLIPIFTKSTPIFTGLSEGTYYVVAENLLTGCTSDLVNATITNNIAIPSITTKIEQHQTSANPATPKGKLSAQAMVNGSTNGFSYSWYKGEIVQPEHLVSSGNIAENLSSGLYTLIINNDVNGCEYKRTATIKDFIQVCSMVGNTGSDQITDKTCSPVSLKMPVIFAFLTDVDPSKVKIRFEWGYNNQTTTYAATYNASLNRYEATGSHIYSSSLLGNCSYTAAAYLVYDGVACTATQQRQTFVFWSTDNENSGIVLINPLPYRVCQGISFKVNFQDQSQFNCRLQVEPDRPNQVSRWTQFIYGPNVAGNKIPNVSVTVPTPAVAGGPEPGVYPLTDASGNIISYATPSGFFEGPVIEIPTFALGPNQTSYEISTLAGGIAGNFFEITLKNWNICNPYKVNGALTGNSPKTTTSRAVMVAKPVANIRITKNSASLMEPEVTKFCPGDRIYFRAATSYPSGAAARNIITLYDGPTEGASRIFQRMGSGATYTTDFLLPNYITSGIKTVVIESFDNNANNSSGSSECSDKRIKHIEVIEVPIAAIITSTGTKDIKFCKNNVDDEFFVSFTDDPGIINQDNTVYSWRFIDINKNTESVFGPSVGSSFSPFNDVLYKSPGAYKVIFSTADMVTKCGTTDIVNITIHAAPKADFEIENQDLIFAGQDIKVNDLSKDFSDLSLLPEDAITSRKWFFDYSNDPDTFKEFNEGEAILHKFENPGNYTIRLVLESGYQGCTSIFKDVTIEVLPLPQTFFSLPVFSCPAAYKITNTSLQDQPTSLSGKVLYSFLIYNGNDELIEEIPAEDPLFEYYFANESQNDLKYKIKLRAYTENGLERLSNFKELIIKPVSRASFTSNYSEVHCSNEHVLFTVSSETQNMDINNYVWTISDGTNKPEVIIMEGNYPNLSYLFKNDSEDIFTYEVSLKAWSASFPCMVSYVQTLKINPLPSSYFEVVGNKEEGFSRCENQTIILKAAEGENFRWYENENDKIPLFEGGTYSFNDLSIPKSIWVAPFDPSCNFESERKEIKLKLNTNPLISTLQKNQQKGTIEANASGDILWYHNENLLEENNKKIIYARKDGIFKINVSKGSCEETMAIEFKGIVFSKDDKELQAPQIDNAIYGWYYNGKLIYDTTSHILPVEKNGTYVVKIILNFETGRLQEQQELLYTFEVTDLDVVLGNKIITEEQKIKVYPNPFYNSLNIELPEPIKDNISISIWNLNGQKIFHQTMQSTHNKYHIEIPDLGNGIYYLDVVSLKKSYKVKITK
ncbi:MAG: T9SS type A sorting domain-containing protein [Bacteroidota bacterium]|nr:T9SS type A sorting domain-containing protein [Bacteroidota bacterium]